jgi:acyl transferase domain-containing protein
LSLEHITRPAVATLSSPVQSALLQWPEIFAFSGIRKKDIRRQLTDLKDRWLENTDTADLKSLAETSRRHFAADDTHRLLMALPVDQNVTEICGIALNLLETRPDNFWVEQTICYGRNEKPGKTAFVFPGQGSQYTGMGRQLAQMFPEIREALVAGDRLFDRLPRLSDYIYPEYSNAGHPPPGEKNSSDVSKSAESPEECLRSTDVAQPAIGALSLGMMRIFENFNVRPEACCGHSFGELTALFAAGRLETETFMTLAVARGDCMAAAGDGRDRGAMLAVGAPIGEIETLIASSDLDVVLANRNGPDQGVISGPTSAVHQMKVLCKERKIRATLLPVAAAFHSRLVENAAKPFQEILQITRFDPGTVPVYANTTALPYPADPDRARQLLGEHLLHPVNFLEEIQNMYGDGIRVFLEIGPKNVLTGLINAILKHQPDTFAFAVDASAGRRCGIMDLAMTLCRLASLGVFADLTRWRLPNQV